MYRGKKKVTIIVMLVAVFVMVVGYAAFSANLIISGTANVASNWNVYISNIETKTVYGKAENASGSPTYSNLSARIKVNLKEPGDYIVYEVTITNGGTLNAIIDNIKATNLGTSAIIHTVEGINKGEPIANGATKKFSVTIEYAPTVTSQPETLDNTLILDINCVQDLNQNIPGGDIDVNAPEIITLSGNNNLTLNSAFPANLANYKISGNSAQDKLPSEYQEVEYIEGTGTQYIELDYTASGMTISKGKFQITNIEKGGFLFGSREASNSDFYGFNWGGGLPYKYYNSYYAGYLTAANIDDQVHTFLKEKGNLYVDGELLHTATDKDFVTPGKMNIFASYNAGASGYLPSLARLFSLQFYDNGKLSVNLIPCYRKSDNTIGLYDSVNNKFYVNKGTGTFLKGKDITNSEPNPDSPIEIVSVGEKTKNLFSLGSADEYFTNITTLTIENNSLTGVVKNDWAGSHVYKLTNYPSGEYYIKFEGETISRVRFMIRCFDSNGTQLDNSTISVSDLTYNTYYKGWFSNATALAVQIPDEVAYWQIGFSFVGNTNEIGDTRTINNIQITEGLNATEYEPYGYKIPVKVSGKNVYQEGDKHYTKSVDFSLSNSIKAGTYTISAFFNNDSDIYDYGLIFYGNKTTIYGNLSYKKGERTSKTVTFNEDVTRLVFYATSTGSTNEGVNASFTDIQIEEGTVATDYEPFIESNITNIYLDEPLRKVGNYADYIDFASGKVVRQLKEVEFNGTEQWSLYTGGNVFVLPFADAIKKYNSSLSSHFKNVNYAWDSLYLERYNLYSDHDSAGNKYFRRPSSNITTAEEFKTWLANEKTNGTPVKLIYTLSTPVENNVTLPNIYIPQGNVQLSVHSNGLDIPMEVSYYKK